MFKKNKGFTLIELLVVIAIIGTLSGLVLVSLGGARSKARDVARQSDIRQIAAALELQYSDDGEYPVITAGTEPTLARITTNLETITPTYLKPWPQDPGGGSHDCNSTQGAYCAFTSSAGGDYCVVAALENDDWFTASDSGISTLSSIPTDLETCK
ncbi:MAG: prepilin-type N-terminal cleavage/methylation domain-containing protein [Candidatus Nealsonbacteria bacterium]|nr:MAG: prepilin-type N-terminal cleavage/methylation domain-containing protein [Candidatus Nealsonbacteria bacterium]